MRPDFPPEYLPVDEAHPMKPAHAYGVSKLVVEDIARGFVLHGDMSITCLRPVAVVVESNLLRTVNRAADPGHRWLGSYVTGEDTGRAFAAALELRRAVRRLAHRRRRLRLGGAHGGAARGRARCRPAGSRNPGWYERDPQASPIDATRATERLRWRPSVDVGGGRSPRRGLARIYRKPVAVRNSILSPDASRP